MFILVRMVSQEVRAVIYCNALYTELNWAQQMVLQIRDLNSLVDHDVICLPHVGIIIQ